MVLLVSNVLSFFIRTSNFGADAEYYIVCLWIYPESSVLFFNVSCNKKTTLFMLKSVPKYYFEVIVLLDYNFTWPLFLNTPYKNKPWLCS